MTIANVHTTGTVETIAVRHCAVDPFDTDGIPLLIGRVEATSCGLWTPTGYRSSRPATVHAMDRPEDVSHVRTTWEQNLRPLAAIGDDAHAWLQQVPRGHPKTPCPGDHCALRMQAQP